jgi:hypothetical protein
MTDFYGIRLDLQRFGEGGGEGGGAAGADGAGAAAEAGNQEGAQSAKAGKTGDLSQVQYGVQEQEAEQKADAPTEQPKQEAPKKVTFDQALRDNPEYAREMQKRIDQAINKRFAKSKAAEEQNAKLMPALNLLSAKYGVEAGNTDALIEAINGDSDLIEQQAMDAGMEPDAYREYQKLKAENEALKKAEEERQRQAAMDSSMREWTAQAERARLKFPTLNLNQEVRNPQFAQLLGSGVDVETAYRVVHMDEIESGLIQQAAAEATKKTVAGIASKANRPRENGAAKPKAATVKADISKLTRADFEEIMRRAARGENIRF